MIRWTMARACFFSVLVGCLTATTAPPLQAEEPAQEFLEQLRARGYYQTALDYLDQMETSQLASNSFRRIIPYEKGVTLIESASFIRDAALKKQMLDDAQLQLDRFIEDQPNHELVAFAKNRLANLLIQRAEVNILNSEKRGTAEADRLALLEEARTQYDQAAEVFARTRDELREKLRAIDPDNQDSRFRNLREQYQSEFLQTLLLLPAVVEQKADTYDEGDAQRNQLLEEAIVEYQSIHEKYRRYEAAFYARIYQSRCLSKLKKFEESLENLQPIFDQDNSPEFREFKKMALVISIECWDNVPGDDTRPFEIINFIEPVLATVPESETREDWLRLRIALAKAYRAAAAVLDAREDTNADDRRQITTYENLSTQLVRDVSKINGPLKLTAQQLLVDWGASRTVVAETVAPPVNFGEARQRGRQRLDDFETAKFAAASLQEKIANAADVAERVALQTQLEEVQKSIDDAPEEALDFFRLAIDFADQADEEEEIADDDLTSTYYFMAYVLFGMAQYEQVGVISEYLMRESPQGAGARETADLALSTYWVLYSGAPPQNRDFEISLLQNLCDEVLIHWAGQAEGVKAATLMSWVELQSDNLPGAEAYLAKIPAEAPQRYESELAIGQEIWKRYLLIQKQVDQWKLEEEPPAQAIAEAEAEAADLLTKALTYLESGSKKLDPESIDEPKAIASLSLAQAYLSSEQVDKAIAHLENARVGLLKLLDRNHDAVQGGWVMVNTYKTAVRAYIGALETASSKQQMIDKSLAVMEKLKAAVGDTPEGRQQLVGIYLGLASDLKRQMDALPTIDEKKTFALGLTAFLDEIRQDADQLDTMIWVARTLSGIGESFLAEGLDDDAKPILVKAGQAYNDILDKGRNNSDWLPDSVRLEVHRQMGRNRRNQGEYESAIESYTKVLAERSSLVDVQAEAAETYELWAEETGSADRFKLAMVGGEARRDPDTGREANVIWGWGKLANIANRYPEFRERFFEARFHLAKCRIAYARIEDSDRYREQARKDVYQTYRLFPELGGPEWYAKYDLLLREIQREMGEARPQGLKAFETSSN